LSVTRCVPLSTVFVCCLFLRDFPQDVETWYADCLEKLPASAWLHIFVAQYAHIYRGNKHIESLHLTAAEGKNGRFDVAQLVQQRRWHIRRSEEAAGGGTMSVVSRIKFEKHRGLVDEHTLRARRDQMRFIEELTAPRPAPDKLDDIAKSFEKSLRLAEESFGFLLKLNPYSSSVLRKYAVFLDEVCNDNLKATKVANQADDIDAATEKEHAEIGAAMVMFAKVWKSRRGFCSLFLDNTIFFYLWWFLLFCGPGLLLGCVSRGCERFPFVMSCLLTRAPLVLWSCCVVRLQLSRSASHNQIWALSSQLMSWVHG
jgi:hypothetical protein